MNRWDQSAQVTRKLCRSPNNWQSQKIVHNRLQHSSVKAEVFTTDLKSENLSVPYGLWTHRVNRYTIDLCHRLKSEYVEGLLRDVILMVPIMSSRCNLHVQCSNIFEDRIRKNQVWQCNTINGYPHDLWVVQAIRACCGLKINVSSRILVDSIMRQQRTPMQFLDRKVFHSHETGSRGMFHQVRKPLLYVVMVKRIWHPAFVELSMDEQSSYCGSIHNLLDVYCKKEWTITAA